MDRPDDLEFDIWLFESDGNLTRSIAARLDLEAALSAIKHQAASPVVTAAHRADLPALVAVGSGGTDVHELLAEVRHDVEGDGLVQAHQTQIPRGEGQDASLQAAIEGDPRATEAVLASIRPLVVRYCRARVGRQERSFASADDVAQEVCLAVLTALPSYRDQGRPFLAFVYGIAAHKVADARRAAGRNRSEPVADVPDEPESDAGPEQKALRQELTRAMGELLQVLPHRQREIVLLRIVVGLSEEETAEAVGSTPGAVRVAQHRALARLRRSLARGPV